MGRRYRFGSPRVPSPPAFLATRHSSLATFLRPLFSYSYKSLFPQPLSFHIHTNPPGVYVSDLQTSNFARWVGTPRRNWSNWRGHMGQNANMQTRSTKPTKHPSGDLQRIGSALY